MSLLLFLTFDLDSNFHLLSLCYCSFGLNFHFEVKLPFVLFTFGSFQRGILVASTVAIMGSAFMGKKYIAKLLQKFNFNFSFFREKSQVVVKGQLREVVILQQEGNITIAPKCQQSSAIFQSIHTKWLLHKDVFQYEARQSCYPKMGIHNKYTK